MVQIKFSNPKNLIQMTSQYLYLIKRLGRYSFSLPAFLTSYLWAKGKYQFLIGFPVTCPFKMLIGIPGPTCYLTRATSEALQGNLIDSINLHLFGPLVAIILLLWSIKSIKYRNIFPYVIKLKTIASTTIILLIYWLFRVTMTYVFNFNMFQESFM